MTRIGKIARLPLHVRNQLNQRLEDGKEGDAILKWLNDLPAVREVLQSKFNGRRINKQNLSAWRLGGFREWQRLQESHAFMHRLVERSDDLEKKGDEVELTDRLALVAAGEMAGVFERLLEQKNDPRERWILLREFLRELVPLRAGDQRAARLALDKEQAEIESDRYWTAKQQHDREELRKQANAPLWAALQVKNLAALFGGGEPGHQAAACILENQYDLEPGTLNRPARSSRVKVSPTPKRLPRAPNGHDDFRLATATAWGP